MALQTLSHDDYTVAWICALPLEMAAAKVMLEEIHGRLPQPRTDHNAYTLGKIHGHNVVIACLPSGIYGTTSATIVLTQMLPTFPSLRFGLLVGIGGGVPGKADVRLGDVVISKPTASGSGVVQYDYGKTVQDRCFQRTGFLNKPPQILLTAISQMESDRIMGARQIKQSIVGVLEGNRDMAHKFSEPDNDWLFPATYLHQGNPQDCSACDLNQLSHRQPRTMSGPYLHLGLIASGNQLLKDAQTRDQIAKELDVLCFEMEAAGLMDLLPCLVIRGICDYCDSHKCNEWQGYAALTAAVYTKSLLSVVPAVVPKGELEKSISVIDIENLQNADISLGVGFTPDEHECLRSLFVTNPADDKNALKRKKGHRADGTCEWILETEELTDWLEGSKNDDRNGSNILWLHGTPGSGKSTMVITMTDELPKQPAFNSGNKVLAYFFCDSSEENQRTAISILRGLLYQLIHQRPRLIKYLLAKYLDRKDTLFTSFDALWTVLLEMGAESSCEIYCMIDALDECEPDSQQTLLRQINQSFARRGAGCSFSDGPYILITSRPYPEISENLSHFRCKDLRSYSAVKGDIKTMIDEKVHDLSKRKNYPKRVSEEVSRILEERAEGTFLWVGIACGELDRPQVQARNAVQTLQKMPRGLYALYDQLLKTALADGDDDDNKATMQMLKYIVCVRRPLTVPELASLCQLYPEEDEISRHQFTRDMIGSCQLMILIQNGRVQLLHKSVKDFLVKEQEKVDDIKSHMELADQCISHILHCLEPSSAENENDAFYKYAVEYWLQHAELAGNTFTVSKHHEPFFKLGSRIWKLWLQDYNATVGTIVGNIDGFSVFHAAARWRIIPLVSWALSANRMDSDLADHVERKYDDKSFKAMTGTTPLEEAAGQGNPAILNALLNGLEAGAEIVVGVSIGAAQNGDFGKEIMAVLLDRLGDQIQITEDVVRAAAGNEQSGKDIMTQLLGRRRDQIYITEDIVKVAARNGQSGKDIITLLLDQRGDQIQITEDVVKAAAQSSSNDVMMLLLDQHRDQFQITEDVVKTAARNGWNGKDIMTLLLDREDQIQITEDVIKASVTNYWNGKDIMTLLLDRRGDEIQITQDLIMTAVEYGSNDVITLLLDRRRDQIQITEDLVKAIVGNDRNKKGIITLLLDQQGDQVQITQDVVEAAAASGSNDVMMILLDQRGDQFQITEDVVKAAAGNYRNGKGIMILLLDQKGDQVQITQDVVEAAAASGSNDVMMLLLDQRGDQFQITEDVVKATAENAYSGEDIMTLLLDQRGDQFQITEDVVKAAARNRHYGKEIMTLLLDRRGYQFQVTEDVVKAAVKNRYSGESIMTVLLDRRGDQIQITEDVVKAAVKNEYSGKKIMTVLFDRRGDQIRITEDVTKAAAENMLSGKEIMTIQITEDVVKAAAGNEESGKDIMILLLGRRGDQIQITTDVLSSAASCGNETILHLLAQNGKQIPIHLLQLARLYNAAKSGNFAKLKQLLSDGTPADTQNIRGVTPLGIASHRGHYRTVEALLQTNQVDVDAKSTTGESPIFLAAACGYASIVWLLLEAHANPNAADINGDTPYDMAWRYRHFDIAKILGRLTPISIQSSLADIKLHHEAPPDIPLMPPPVEPLSAGWDLVC
ncbi:Pfs, NACHT, and Ankyrin domain protein [Talaromyces marneffei ATCC 18224]|uniref:Pfs, NACHT, and Ankyrin domain protein n=1 Tax=Talaromyces marneffei (strain ATCC 18224 / CBS 334.59 / QM 7333) TaxID=441960 RepID=B6QM28_TALMQ|nr:Pfs, NACHT, and Ankyrin domain protein [Talaromyces marneffei ATCC 18224]